MVHGGPPPLTGGPAVAPVTMPEKLPCHVAPLSCQLLGTRDEVSNQHSYCFNVKDDPKTFDKAMKSQDVAFWKEAINDEMDSITGNNT
ncbi:hypothetical protein Tco_0497670 [Tanacetum coccineum]